MAEFKGLKEFGATRYDKVYLSTYDACVRIGAFGGFNKDYASAGVTTTTARKIAAKLTRMADAIDAQQGAKE